MCYNSEKEKEIAEAINSGKYSVATLGIFETIKQIDISDKLIRHLEYTTDFLREHLEEVYNLNEKKPGISEYLKAIKVADIVDNQSLEKENSFLIGLYMQVKKENAIDKLIKLMKQKEEISSTDICKIHQTLLYGTSSEETELIRTKNEKFVGKIVNGERIINYFPIDYHDIEVALDEISKLYNDETNSVISNNVFLQPILIHGLFGALQLFDDGNTRMGRLMQHVLMWSLINKQMEFNFENPPIYATRSYSPYRAEYRSKISSLVVNNNSEAWNEWFNFNLNRIEDQIYMNDENIKVLKRKLGI